MFLNNIKAARSVILLLMYLENVKGQFVSPCPRLFAYEVNNAEEDTWYGQITLIYNSDLSGIWVKLLFDRPVIEVGNWFGDVDVKTSTEIAIKNPTYLLKANNPVKVRIFVKYDPKEPPPLLTSYLINSRTICPEGGLTLSPLTSSKLFTSGQAASKSNSNSQSTNPPHLPPPASVIKSGKAVSNPSPNPSNSESEEDESVGCGVVAPHARPLIYFGEETFPGQWPWHAALYYFEDGMLNYTCGGTLISKNHVATVAHCVTKPHTNKLINADILAVYLGKHNLKVFDETTQFREVSKIYLHSEYNASVYVNDIAILELSSPAKITKYVRLCCLWEDNPKIDLVMNKIGTVVGFGFDEKNKLSNKLMQAQMPIINTVDCIYSNPAYFSSSRFSFEKSFCAGLTNGTTVCNGDSGGGFVLPKEGSSRQNPVWQLRGLVSIGFLQGIGYCDESTYIIFTDVAQYKEWIEQILAKSVK